MRATGTWILTATAMLALGCGEAAVVNGGGGQTGAAGKGDSGWLGADSFEVDARVRGVVVAPPGQDWSDLRTDPALQAKLVDLQLKFVKTTAESRGWRFNQLADTVEVIDLRETEQGPALEYVAVVDMLGELRGSLPELEDLDPRQFEAVVPQTPGGFAQSTMAACSEVDGGHSVADYNFHYYFAPGLEGCLLELSRVQVEITEVFERPVTYPEYDQLLQQLDEHTVGFRAALVPNRGDEDPRSRFDAHARMLENDLGLSGTDMEGGAFRRYTWRQGDVAIVIDLYDPSELPWSGDFGSHFRKRLGDYTLVHYNGHSSYGSKHLLDEPEAYSDAYQIISIHSCQSYAYYTRQIFRAKATEEDPSGFATADVLATGRSSYPTGAPPTLRTLLQSLMEGMAAVQTGQPHLAPDWLSITKRITGSTWGDILYGMAGVRTNRWQP